MASINRASIGKQLLPGLNDVFGLEAALPVGAPEHADGSACARMP